MKQYIREMLQVIAMTFTCCVFIFSLICCAYLSYEFSDDPCVTDAFISAELADGLFSQGCEVVRNKWMIDEETVLALPNRVTVMIGGKRYFPNDFEFIDLHRSGKISEGNYENRTED